MKPTRFMKILFVALTLMAMNANAAVDLKNYLGAALPKTEAPSIMGKVFMHNLDVLKNVDVEVADMQERKNGIKVVFFYVGRLSTQMNTEIYAMSFDKGWNAIDGMMLGYSGDAQVLKLDMPEGYYYETNPDLPFSIVGDTLKMERTYRYGTSKKGQQYFNQLGTVTSSYLIAPDGVFTQLPIVSVATESHGDTGSGEPVTGQVEGLFNLFGSKILAMAHRPVSAGLDMEAMNAMAADALTLVDDAGDNPTMNQNTLNVIEFARWSTSLGLRVGEPFLKQVANDGKPLLIGFISAAMHEGEFLEAAWLKESVNFMKNKSAREWWKEWLSKQGF